MDIANIRALKIIADMDVSRYTAAAREKAEADAKASGSGAKLGDSLNDNQAKLTRAADGLRRLAATYVDGVARAQKFNSALGQLNAGLDRGRITTESAAAIIVGMAQKLGIHGNAAELAAKRQYALANAMELANQELREQAGLAETAQRAVAQHAASASRMHGAANDNTASGRRQNLVYQAFDVVQTAPYMSAGAIALQQGPQVLQAYMGAGGGVKALLGDMTAMAAGFVRMAGPWAVAAAGVYAGYRILAHDAEAAALAVDGTTAALAAQAAPIGTVQGMIGELATVQVRYREAIALTGSASTVAGALTVSATQAEFNAKQALLALELKRQEAVQRAAQSEIELTQLQARRDAASIPKKVFTDLSPANPNNAGFVDGSGRRFVQLPDEITGLQKTQDLLAANTDKLIELRSNYTLTGLVVDKLRDALGTTFDGALIEPATRAAGGFRSQVSGLSGDMAVLARQTDSFADTLARIKEASLPALSPLDQIDKDYAAGINGARSIGAASLLYDEAEKARQRIRDQADADKFTSVLQGAGSRPNALEMDDPYEAILKSGRERIRQLELEAGAIGLVGPALERYRFEQGLISDAYRQNIALTEQQIAGIHKLGEGYEPATDSRAASAFSTDIIFEEGSAA